MDQHILRILATGTASARPVTISDLARQFGVSAAAVLSVARLLVNDGLATASVVEVHGVPTLRGLLPLTAGNRPS
jgi:hypothetical protein